MLGSTVQEEVKISRVPEEKISQLNFCMLLQCIVP